MTGSDNIVLAPGWVFTVRNIVMMMNVMFKGGFLMATYTKLHVGFTFFYTFTVISSVCATSVKTTHTDFHFFTLLF